MNQKYRIIVAGSRTFGDYELLRSTLDEYILNFLDVGLSDTVEIISGRAAGADRLGEKFADEQNIPVTCFEADWETFGKIAGPIRNRHMAEYASERGYVGILIAFWDGMSRGTKNMIETAKKYDLDVVVINELESRVNQPLGTLRD